MLQVVAMHQYYFHAATVWAFCNSLDVQQWYDHAKLVWV
jgi:hypothetical protein